MLKTTDAFLEFAYVSERWKDKTDRKGRRKKDGREGKKKIRRKNKRERNRKRSPKPWLSLYRDPGANIPDGIFPKAGGALICTASHHLGC